MTLWTLGNIGEGRLNHQQALVMGPMGSPYEHIEYHKANRIKDRHNNEVKKYQAEIKELKEKLAQYQNLIHIDIVEPIPEFDKVLADNFWELI